MSTTYDMYSSSRDLQITAISLMMSLFCNFMIFQVLFQVNKRPDFETMKTAGIRVNNENQSLVRHVGQQYSRQERDKLYYMGVMPAKEVNKKHYDTLQQHLHAVCLVTLMSSSMW